MDQRFLEFYNQELKYIRESASDFGRAFPKIANRLNLNTVDVADPYVERLLEGFAFMSARVQRKLDAQFPEFSQNLQQIVYPQYQAPIPSQTIVEFEPDLQDESLQYGYSLPKGTQIRSVASEQGPSNCRFRTCHDVTFWPLKLSEANYFDSSSSIGDDGWELLEGRSKVKAALKLQLTATAGLKVCELAIDELVFHATSTADIAGKTFEQLFAHCVGIQIRSISQDGDRAPSVSMPINSLNPYGFEDDQGMIPYVDRSFQGYRLLQEYFCFSRRFHFFSLSQVQEYIRDFESQQMEIVFLFDKSQAGLNRNIDESSFSLNSVPVINLFPMKGDRAIVKPGTNDIHLVADRSRPMDFEIYSIEKMVGVEKESHEQLPVDPYYGNTKGVRLDEEAIYYAMKRKPRLLSEKQKQVGTRSIYLGSETYIALVSNHKKMLHREISQIEVDLLCTNRDLPLHITLGSGPTDFTLDVAAPVLSIKCISEITEPKPALDASEQSWRFINQLSLNYLSLVGKDGKQGAEAVKKLLSLFVFSKNDGMLSQVEAVQSVLFSSVSKQILHNEQLTYCRGIEINLTCDETAFEGAGLFLFASVLEHFFARYVSVNSFTQFVLHSVQRGELKRWQPRLGKTHLI